MEWQPWFEYKATVVWHKTNPVTRVRKTTTVSSNEWIQICRRTDNGKSAQPVAWNYLKHNEMHNLIKGEDVVDEYIEGGLCGGNERMYWHVLDPVHDDAGEIVGGQIIPCLRRQGCPLCKANVERRRHGTQKPLYVWQWIYERYTKPGLRVYDPFTGTGSSGVAAMQYGLDWFGSELSWEYVQVAQMNLAGTWGKPQHNEKQMEMF
jgi:DNA modification methylase